MEKKLKKRYRVLQIGALVLLLAGIRLFEEALFYDPLIVFFRSDYLLDRIPRVDMALLLFNMGIRFLLNTIISLAIIFLAFRDKQITTFATLLYLIIFVVGFSVFTYLMLNMENEHYLALFYVRRFLIHPLFLLILLPAFYYYRIMEYKRS